MVPDHAARTEVTVVIATRDRVAALCATLARLTELPERPDIIVVDNASRDRTAATVQERFPQVELIRLEEDLRACARNVGARRARTPYVAFSDGGSWWMPGALRRACHLLAAHDELGLIAGHALAGPEGSLDPMNDALATSPLPRGSLPGPRVLDFLGCAAVVRRTAFLAAGGYRPIPGRGPEEQLLALDLAARGWACAYCADVLAWHQPWPAREVAGRRYLLARDQAIIAWLRRPLGRAVLATLALVRAAPRDRAVRRALGGLILALPGVLAARRRLPRQTERQLALLEHRAQPAARTARRILTRAGRPRPAAVPTGLPAPSRARLQDTSGRPA